MYCCIHLKLSKSIVLSRRWPMQIWWLYNHYVCIFDKGVQSASLHSKANNLLSLILVEFKMQLINLFIFIQIMYNSHSCLQALVWILTERYSVTHKQASQATRLCLVPQPQSRAHRVRHQQMAQDQHSPANIKVNSEVIFILAWILPDWFVYSQRLKLTLSLDY